MDLSDFRNVLEQKSVALCLEVAGHIHLRMESLIGMLWRVEFTAYVCVRGDGVGGEKGLQYSSHFTPFLLPSSLFTPLLPTVPGLLEHNPLPGMPTVPASPQGSFGRLFGGRQRLVTADMVVDEVCACACVLCFVTSWPESGSVECIVPDYMMFDFLLPSPIKLSCAHTILHHCV